MASGFSRKAAGVGEAGAGRHTISWRRRALWVVLALVPSTLLLGVTQHLATDVVSAPLLWVVPLALYLTTFIAAFLPSRGLRAPRGRWGAVAPVAALLVLLLSLAEVRYPILLVALVHLAAFTVLAMLCHTRLAESRPDAAHLTEYFAWVSLGGVLGGAAAALVAPVVFSSILEYPLALAAALFLRPQTLEADRAATSRARRLAWRVSAALLLVAGYWCVSALNEQGTSSPLTTNASFAWLQSFTADVPIAIRASLAIPAALLLFTSRTALLFAATTAGLLDRSGRGQNRRRRARPRAHVLRRAPGDGHPERRLARPDAWHDDARRAGGSRQAALAADGLLPSVRSARRRRLHARARRAVPRRRGDRPRRGRARGLRRQRRPHGLFRDRRCGHPHRGESSILHLPGRREGAAGGNRADGGSRRPARAPGHAGSLVRSDRRRRVLVGRDPDASHHPRGRGRVRVAPEGRVG